MAFLRLRLRLHWRCSTGFSPCTNNLCMDYSPCYLQPREYRENCSEDNAEDAEDRDRADESFAFHDLPYGNRNFGRTQVSFLIRDFQFHSVLSRR